jgi:hypothetical protein
MTEKDRQIIKAIILGLMFFVIAPTIIEACPDGDYPSVIEWWNQGKAQLTLNCRDYLDPRSRFWSDDLIGNLLGNYSHWIAGLTVSAWNGLVLTWYGQLILLGVGAVFSNLIYDLLKYVVKMIFFSEGK